jgi:ribose 5-phosphate isomerase A
VVNAAARFVVIVSEDKLVEAIEPPIPLELLAFEVEATLRACAPARLRDGPPSPDGGLIGDYTGPVGDPAVLAARLSAVPGVVEHGLFPPSLVSEILVGTPSDGVERILPGT